MKLSTILNYIDDGGIALPEFQRGYVWNREQVRGLMHSLYRRYPVGSLMMWVTEPDELGARGDGRLALGSVKLLLDGQQRITSLYGIVNGAPPKFFDGNPLAFKDLHFNVRDEVFEFYTPIKMKDDPLWVDVTSLMQNGPMHYVSKFYEAVEPEKAVEYLKRLNTVHTIQDIDFHIEEVVGPDKTIDVVVDVFNRVNSGGTKLSKGDLALARICAHAPETRSEMNARLAKWEGAGYPFSLDWLLRNVNTILTGEARFVSLKDTTPSQFADGLNRAEQSIDAVLNMIASRLGLDHGRVLGAVGAIPLLTRYVDQAGGFIADSHERDRILYWYVHAMLWGRFAGSTESVLNQDLHRIAEAKDPITALVDGLRQNRGDLTIEPNDMIGWSIGARFYPLLYMLTRVAGSLDWETGDELKKHSLGKMSQLEVHHIFPKARLYEAGYERAEVNALGNYTFLTKPTNLKVSDKDPAIYLKEYYDKDPQLLESHWIPCDPALWQIDRYPEFLAERRRLLADAANEFLDRLWTGKVKEAESQIDVTSRIEVPWVGTSIEDEAEAQMLAELQSWMVSKGLPQGNYSAEMVDEQGNVLGIFDLSWAEGIQVGLTQPVAVLLGETDDVEQLANSLGYRYFTDAQSFKKYVTDEILRESHQASDSASATAN